MATELKNIFNKAKANAEKCKAFTKKCTDEFISKFNFLKEEGFEMTSAFHKSTDPLSNLDSEEYYVILKNRSRNFHCYIQFPMEKIKNGKCDFVSYTLDIEHPYKYQEYTYQSGAMTLATLFG